MVTKLRVQNFRKHSNFTIDFVDSPNIIIGQNGSGKTSLVEAIYIALQGKSWRSTFAEILNNNQDENWWRIDIELSDGEKRTVKFVDGKKEFIVDGKVSARLPAKFKKPALLFEPGDLQLLYGSPSRRRDFIDKLIIQIDPAHATELRKLERVLKQRNFLLKNNVSQDDLFVWDVQFADISEKVINTRIKWVNKINEHLSGSYNAVAETNDDIKISYSITEKSRNQILSQLKDDYTKGYSYTRSGPQAHDVVFRLNNQLAKTTASRGESRTIIIGAISAMVRIINEELDQKAYLILDDISSELDETRLKGIYSPQLFGDNFIFSTAVNTDKNFGFIHNIE